MIAKLKGIVDVIDDDGAVIDVGGVGYRVFCSSRTLGRLAIGRPAALMVETHVREDHIHLFGFAEPAERDWYRLLTTVQGVGSRVALALLSVLSPDQLVQAVAAGDRDLLTRASGVGPKLAQRVLSELKDKVGAVALGAAARAGGAPVAVGGATADAVSALVNLGYGASEALGAVSKATERLGPGAPVEALIRAGLSALAPGELGA